MSVHGRNMEVHGFHLESSQEILSVYQNKIVYIRKYVMNPRNITTSQFSPTTSLSYLTANTKCWLNSYTIDPFIYTLSYKVLVGSITYHIRDSIIKRMNICMQPITSTMAYRRAKTADKNQVWPNTKNGGDRNNKIQYTRLENNELKFSE